MTASARRHDASAVPLSPAGVGFQTQMDERTDDATGRQLEGRPRATPTGLAPLRPHVEGGVGVLHLANVLLRRWQIVLGVPLLTVLSASAFSFLATPRFTTTASFVAEVRSGSRLPTGLVSLAAQFGVTTGSEPSQGPRFYAEVLESRLLMERVLLDRYLDVRRDHNPGDSATLIDILNVRGKDAAQRTQRAVKVLDELVSARVDPQTGIVRLLVDAPHPELGSAVANRFLYHLNEFNTKTRQSQARERRRFVEERVAAVAAELRQAEEDLKEFYERNRSWRQSAQLVVEEDRLQRQLQIRQELYLTLNREYEAARIEEVNDTPVITVIDPAVPPREPSRPRWGRNLILAAVVGGLMALVFAFAADYLDRSSHDGNRDYEEFRVLLRKTRHEAYQLLRLTSSRLR